MATPVVQHVSGPATLDARVSKKKQKGVLYVGQNAVLKPVNNCVSGRREVDFYNTVFRHHHQDENNNDDVVTLKRFLPQYLGLEERAGVSHIKLENLMSCFKRPCMADIKMGHVTSDPWARPEKVAQRKSKYPNAHKLGFALSGFSVYSPETCDFERTDKYTCHNFTLQQVFVDGLGKYFGFPHNPRRDVITCLLRKLEAIRQWFLSQRHFAFYASSLLFVYDGSCQRVSPRKTTPFNRTEQSQHCKTRHALKSRNSDFDSNSASCLNSSRTPLYANSRCSDIVSAVTEDVCDEKENVLVDVRLIDFTHAFPTKERDDNYLSGLENLINILKILQSWMSCDSVHQIIDL